MTRDELFQELLSLVPQAEQDGMKTENNSSVYQAVAHGLAQVSSRRLRKSEAEFLLHHSLQKGPPASFLRRAKFLVEITRTGNTDVAIYAQKGSIVMEGPDGRLYVNVDTVDYARRDENPVREAYFECIVPGEVGNLEFLINDDLTMPQGKPAGWFPPEYVAFANQSRGRSNKGASSLQAEGTVAIKDTGKPAVFELGDAGLYLEILDSTVPTTSGFPPENIGRLLRIRDHRWPGIEEPAGSNIRPTLALIDDNHVRERFQFAQMDDGGVFSGYTDELNSYDSMDVPLLSVAPANGDAFYFAAASPIYELYVRLDQMGSGEWDIIWEIWTGTTWATPLNLLDGTSGFRVSGLVHVDGVPQQNPTTVNGLGDTFWVRARVANFISIIDQPIAGYGYPLCFESLHPQEGTVEWIIRDWRDLGFTITSIQQTSLGRDDDLGMIGDNRGLYPEQNESEEQFRRRIAKLPDVVTPAALTRVANRLLAPLKLKARIIDIGDDVLGFFLDNDFLDYYEPGDAYPLSPWKLWLDMEEAYGHFYVIVPRIADGDFGLFFDVGPSLYLPDKGLYLGPCFDDGFMDGFSPSATFSIYPNLYREMKRRKLGGVNFSILPEGPL